MECIKKCKLVGDICIGCNRTMTEIKAKYEEPHPGISWPSEPPKVIDHLPEPKPEKKRCIHTVCKHYYNKCFTRIKQK